MNKPHFSVSELKQDIELDELKKIIRTITDNPGPNRPSESMINGVLNQSHQAIQNLEDKLTRERTSAAELCDAAQSVGMRQFKSVFENAQQNGCTIDMSAAEENNRLTNAIRQYRESLK